MIYMSKIVWMIIETEMNKIPETGLYSLEICIAATFALPEAYNANLASLRMITDKMTEALKPKEKK